MSALKLNAFRFEINGSILISDKQISGIRTEILIRATFRMTSVDFDLHITGSCRSVAVMLGITVDLLRRRNAIRSDRNAIGFMIRQTTARLHHASPT